MHIYTHICMCLYIYTCVSEHTHHTHQTLYISAHASTPSYAQTQETTSDPQTRTHTHALLHTHTHTCCRRPSFPTQAHTHPRCTHSDLEVCARQPSRETEMYVRRSTPTSVCSRVDGPVRGCRNRLCRRSGTARTCTHTWARAGENRGSFH